VRRIESSGVFSEAARGGPFSRASRGLLSRDYFLLPSQVLGRTLVGGKPPSANALSTNDDSPRSVLLGVSLRSFRLHNIFDPTRQPYWLTVLTHSTCATML
jgi:hypothetical protein